MNFHFSKIIIFTFIFLSCQFVLSQENDKLGTEVVNVVKPYTAAVSDAFKVKETPVIEDEINTQKEPIQYQVFSFPVASTFKPAKGKPAPVEKEAKEKYFANYATLGFGNYGTALGELFVTHQIDRNAYVGGMLRHLSSQGGIKDALLDDNFSNTSLDLTYGSSGNNRSWNVDLGFRNQLYNWYGIDPLALEGFTPEEVGQALGLIDPKQTYNNFYAAGRLSNDQGFFKGAEMKFNRFWDGFNSGENRFVGKSNLLFKVSETAIKTNFMVDYLGGSFERNLFTEDKINYAITNIGAAPSIELNQGDWRFNLGAALFYSMDSENSKNKFFIYPQVNASVNLVGDYMIFYAGLEGSLEQNSYHDLVNENPFLSPTLNITPTDRQYDFFAGLKGKFASQISYNVRGGIISEKNRALFVSNRSLTFDGDAINTEGYAYGNSFSVAYQNMTTLQFFGAINADFSKNFTWSADIELNSFSVSNNQEAWNLPAIQLSTTADFKFAPKWSVGAKVFFVGERKDLISILSDAAVFPPIFTQEIRTLKSFVDANVQLNYQHNQRISAFLKVNNFANQAYQRWMDYPAQQFQILAGANIKFDF